MSLSCGIVGLPNVGKSTLFNALTAANVEAMNFPFCTIEPNTGIVPVDDPRLHTLTTLVQPERTIPTTMQFIDIAGLVAGASTGEGLGNTFLAHIREVTAIVHVVRCFADSNITHVHGKVDPQHDIAIINTELALADIASLEKAATQCSRQANSGDAASKKKLGVLTRALEHLEAGNMLRCLAFDEAEQAILQPYHLLTAKPVLYVANVDEATLQQENAEVAAVRAIAANEQAEVVVLCNTVEAQISSLDAQERQDFLAMYGLTQSGLQRLVHASFTLLGLQSFFTAGPKEVRAWTIPVGATAQQAAGVIHTDFSRGFIKAQVIGFADFINYKGEQGAKENGKLRIEGKQYLVHDGDVIHFRFQV